MKTGEETQLPPDLADRIERARRNGPYRDCDFASFLTVLLNLGLKRYQYVHRGELADAPAHADNDTPHPPTEGKILPFRR
jgi:hypothetical protein